MRQILTHEESIPLNIQMPAPAAPSWPTKAIIDLIHRNLKPGVTEPITAGLPAGATLLPDQQLAIGGTVCTVPLFREAMEKVARGRNIDVILARHDTYPELLSAVLWDATVRVNGYLLTLIDLVLYVQGLDDYWLVPSKVGPSLRISRHGLHLVCEPPFTTWNERCTGVCEAAKRIVKAARPGLEG